MAGEDEEIRIRGSVDGDIADALERIEQRVERVERSLDSMGDSAQQAGRKVSSGTDEAADGLRKAERAADDASTSLQGVEGAADRAADELGATGTKGRAAAGGLEDAASAGRSAAKALGDVADDARDAGAGMEAARKGADDVADELGRVSREGRLAARALDDAGDEAAESGAKAAVAATGWERLVARMDRGERVSARWSRMQSAMRWSNWTSSVTRFGSGMRGVLSLDYDGAAKRVGRLSKQFGGWSKVMMAMKIGVIVAGIYALLGAVSALAAGAVGAVGGILSMTPALAAVAGVAVVAKLAMLGLKAGLKESQPEVDALKAKFQGFGASVAAGGLRKGLTDLTKDLTQTAKQTNLLGEEIGAASKYVMASAGGYITGTRFANQYGVVIDHTRGILENLGSTALNAGIMMVTGISASMPAATRLSADLRTLTYRWMWQLDAMNESGRLTEVVNQAYDRLRRALKVVADWTVGLFRIFRIAAQESAWMGTSIEESARKFREWTGSIEGQNAIRDYFVNAMPAVREAGLLIRDIFYGFGKMAAGQDLAPLLNQIRTELLPALLGLTQNLQTNLLPGLVEMATSLANIFSGLDFSGLQLFVDGLNALLHAIIWAQQNIPGFNFALSTLLTIMFMLGPAAWVVSKVLGVFGKIGSAFSWISKAKAGTGELTRMQKIMGPLFQWVGRLAGWFGQVVGRALLWVFTAFTRLGGVMGILRMIGAAFMAVVAVLGWPVTLIIAAVALIVGAFIWLWNNCEWFREGVKSVLSAVGGFFVMLWQDYVWPALKAVGDFFVWLWQSVIVPVAQGIWTVLKWVGAILFVILVAPFLLIFDLIASAANWFYNSVIVPVFWGLVDLVGWVFNNVIMPIANFFVSMWNASCLAVQFAYYAYIVPALNALGQFFSWIFNNVIMPVVNFFIAAWNATCLAVQFAYYAYIVPALNALGQFFSWIFNNVIMPVVNFFVWLWNYACAAVQIAYYTYIQPVLQFFASVLNWLWLNVATPVINGILFLWNALQSGISYVYYNLIQPVFNAIGTGLDMVRGWFQSAVDGIGAIWNGLRAALAAPVNFLIGWVWNRGILPAWNWVAEKLGLPVGQPMQEIPAFAAGGGVRGRGTGTSDDIPAMLSNGEHVWTAKEVRAAGGHDQVMRLRRMVLKDTLPLYASGGPVTPQEMHAAVSNVLPGTRLTSHFRPGDSGYHGKNRAADLAGPRGMDMPFMRRIDEFIGTTFPGSSELIHTPGPYNIKNGSPFTYSAGVRADHYDHVHWANNGSAGGEGGGSWIGQTLWEIGKPILDGILNPIIDGIPWHGPPQFFDIPKRAATTAKDAFYAWAQEKLGAISVGGGDAAPGTGPVWDQIKAVADRWGWGEGAQWANLAALIQKESSGNPTAQNPTTTAYGLFQFLNGTWGTVGGKKTSNPGEQTEYGLRYIKQRYRDPIGAWTFHKGHNWYDDGGMLPPGPSLVMNGTGRPEPVFTGDQWDTLSSGLFADPFAGMSDSSALVAAMMSTPQTYDAQVASGRDGQLDRLEAAIDRLSQSIDERPPPISAAGAQDIAAEVERALARHERRRELRGKYAIRR